MKPKFINIEGLYPTLSKYLPGWIKGTYYCITGATGSGKSKFARYSFVDYPYKYCKENHIPLRIIYFALEESADYFWTSILLDILNQKYNVQLTYYQYRGFHEGMTDEIRELINSIIPEIDDMKQYIHVYDDIGNPTGLLKTIQKELSDLGTFVKGETTKDEFGNDITRTDFVYHDPNTHVIVVADHIGLLEPEQNKISPVLNLHQAISKWSEYVVKMVSKRYNCIAVSVHQQEMAGENNDNFKLGRLEPSETKYGDNKLVGRDYMVSLGIFNPVKYQLQNYLGYTMKDFGDNFRTVQVIKHRNGIPNIVQAMWFDGIGNKYEELPKPGTPELIKFIQQKK